MCYRRREVDARRATVVGQAENDGDAQLVHAIAAGDRHALARLYDRYAPILLGVAQRVLGERREAEDLVHDVFLEAWRQSETFDPERGSVRAWLLMRLRSRAIDRRKAASHTRVVSLEDGGLPEHQARAGADDPLLGPDRTAVRRALAELPEDQRVVLLLGYFEGLSSSEIATRLGAPIGTVKSRVAAALARLRGVLGGERAADQGGAR
jgi:RNA polymerase sigma-70 factor (ECF subfamily)